MKAFFSGYSPQRREAGGNTPRGGHSQNFVAAPIFRQGPPVFGALTLGGLSQ
jgi:hypothetical protein